MAGKLEFNGSVINAAQQESAASIPTDLFTGKGGKGLGTPCLTTTGSLPVDGVAGALSRGGNDHDADDGVVGS